MQEKPLVSFCLFTYNQKDFIKEAVEGALKQSYSPLEIIISDDCSTDGTFEQVEALVKKYNGPHKIITIKNELNLGLVPHINKVLYSETKGKYLVLAAGDDISLPERVSISVNYLENNPDVDILSSSLVCINSQSEVIANERFNFKNNEKFDVDYYLKESFKHINGPSRVLSRKLINAFPELNKDTQTEDSTFLFRGFLFSKVGVLSEKLVKYRIHENNLSSKEGLKKFNVEKIFDQYKDDLVFSINKYIDEKIYKKIEQNLEYKHLKRINKLKKEYIPFYKKIVYRTLNLFFSNYKSLINAWFNNQKTLKEVLLNIFNYKFPRKNTISIGGSTFSKNYGDALNVIITQQLFGDNYFENSYIKSNNEELLMIGSIIHKATSNSLIWGSGCISKNSKINTPKKVFAVRGPLTREVLLKNNIKCPEVYGDPALILPMFYKPKKLKKYKYGLLPHYMDKHHKVVRAFSKRTDVKVIDVEVGYLNWKNFIDELAECENIISSSLHGVILSDAYNIPNVWVVFTDNVIGDGFKFRDYYGSVSKDIITPVNLKSKLREDLIIKRLNDWIPISFDLYPLIKAFPYKIKK